MFLAPHKDPTRRGALTNPDSHDLPIPAEEFSHENKVGRADRSPWLTVINFRPARNLRFPTVR